MDPTTQSKLMALNRDLRNISQQIDQLMFTGETSGSSNIESIPGESSKSVTSLPVKEVVSRDILEVVYNHLSPEQRAGVSRACKQWREILISNGDRWGSVDQPIIVKRLQNLPQAINVVDFFKALPRFSIKLFVHNPPIQVNTSGVWFVSYQSKQRFHIRQLTTFPLPDATNSVRSFLVNLEILCALSGDVFGSPSPHQKFKKFQLSSNITNIQNLSTIESLELSNCSPWVIFQFLRRKAGILFSVHLKQASGGAALDQNVPILLQKIELTCLYILELPTDFSVVASIFANFTAPQLTILEGSASSILGLRPLLHSVRRLTVVLDFSEKDHEGEVLKLLGILNLASSLQSLHLGTSFETSKPMKQSLNVDCLLKLLQVKKQTDGFYVGAQTCKH